MGAAASREEEEAATHPGEWELIEYSQREKMKSRKKDWWKEEYFPESPETSILGQVTPLWAESWRPDPAWHLRSHVFRTLTSCRGASRMAATLRAATIVVALGERVAESLRALPSGQEWKRTWRWLGRQPGLSCVMRSLVSPCTFASALRLPSASRSAAGTFSAGPSR